MLMRRKRKLMDEDRATEDGPASERAKLAAIQLLRKTLGSRLESKLIAEIVSGLETRLEVSPRARESSMEAVRPESPRSSADGHDESCYSCNTGGELLCCDTCSVVFHLHCLWPKLTSIPEGAWSCPFCVVQGVVEGDVTAAEQAIKKIHFISRGIATSASARADALVSHLDDGTVTVQRCSGRFLVRENESNQAVEVGRCYTLHEALEAAHALSNGQSYQFSAVLSHDVQPSVLPADAQNSGENGKLRCMYCLDNTSILVCAFCGCKSCFEKINEKSMLTCNDCGYRWHPRCILGQHAARKVALPWYCQYCTRNHPEPAIGDSSLAPGTPVSNAGIDANVGSSARKHPKKKKKVESIDPPALNAMDEFDAATFVCSPERELGIVSTDLALEMKGQNYIEIAQQEEAASESYDGFVISVDNVCNIIAQLPDKILSRKELAIISAFRVWATLTELRKVFALLIDKNGGHGRAASIALTGSEAKSDYSAPIIDSGSLQSDIDEGVAFETVHNMCFLDSTAITSPGLICVSDHMLLDDDLPAFPEYGDLDEL